MNAAERDAFISQPLTAVIATVDAKGRRVPIFSNGVNYRSYVLAFS